MDWQYELPMGESFLDAVPLTKRFPTDDPPYTPLELEPIATRIIQGDHNHIYIYIMYVYVNACLNTSVAFSFEFEL